MDSYANPFQGIAYAVSGGVITVIDDFDYGKIPRENPGFTSNIQLRQSDLVQIPNYLGTPKDAKNLKFQFASAGELEKLRFIQDSQGSDATVESESESGEEEAL